MSIFIFFTVEEQAKLEYMTKDERELWHNFHDTLNQIKNLESFKETLRNPQDENTFRKCVHKRLSKMCI